MLINNNWTFYKVNNPDIKINVDLPYDAMLREERNINNPGGERISYFKGDDYVYEKEIDLYIENRTIYFYFEGIYHSPSIYINDTLVAKRESGYLPLFFDATKYLKNGKNIIKVISINSDQPNSRWYSGSGIYRNVHMFNLPNKHIVPLSFQINTLDYSTGKIEIKAQLSTKSNSILSIFDKENVKIIEKVYDSEAIDDVIEVINPNLWSAENPYLYKAVLRIDGQEESLKFGIRSVSLDKTKGLLVNGNKINGIIYGLTISILF